MAADRNGAFVGGYVPVATKRALQKWAHEDHTSVQTILGTIIKDALNARKEKSKDATGNDNATATAATR